jgi:hypothetical protein
LGKGHKNEIKIGCSPKMETDLTDLLDFWDGDKYLTYDIY